jgi:predicted flap endonuclease-1-like 5' DNA nuclease
MTVIEENWLLILLAAAVAALIAWYIFHAARRTRVTAERRDVLDQGSPPAARNQALIDAAPASAAVPPATPPGLAGAGEAVAMAVELPPAPPDAETGGDLARLKGVGPKLIAQLRALGITELSQVAAWSEEDLDRIDAQLGRFQGRIRRDNWVEQARLLSAGDEAGYAARFGNIG